MGSPNLDKSSRSMPIPSASTKDEKKTFSGKRGTFESSRGGFVEDSSTKIVKTKVFIKQEALFEGSTFPMWLFHGPEPNNSGKQRLRIETHEFYQGRDDILVGHVLEHHDLRRMKAN